MGRADGNEDARIADAIKSLAEYTARKAEERRVKEEKRQAEWTEYYEQLGRGNSNIGAGAKRSRLRTKVYRLW